MWIFRNISVAPQTFLFLYMMKDTYVFSWFSKVFGQISHSPVTKASFDWKNNQMNMYYSLLNCTIWRGCIFA